MARKKLTQKLTGFPMFQTQTNGFTFPLTHSFTKDLTGLDGLSLDLQFATDKTLTARKGPTPVFTRASGATQVNAAGLIEYAPENTYFPSELLTGAPTNVTLSRITGDSVIASPVFMAETSATGLHRVFSNNVTADGLTICSYIIKEAGRDFVFFNGTSGHPSNTFNLSSGAFTNNTGWSAISLGSGWWRIITPVFTPSGASGVAIQINTTSAVFDSSYAGDITKGILIGGIQRERSSTARTYIPTTTAAVYGARFDHDPSTLVSKGLLIEESRTNSTLRSEDLTNATWIPLGATITGNVIASPDGLTTADRLDEDLTTQAHQVIQQAPTLTASAAYTFSIFAKAASHTSFQIVLSTVAFGGTAFANFILTGAGSVGTSSGVTTKIESFPSGWYRCSVSIASVTGGASGFTQCLANNNNSSAARLTIYTGTNAQTVYLWGAQLETGSFPTSYIPTTTASVVRSADVCSITGSDFTGFYNQSEGTFLTQSIKTSTNANAFIFQASDNSFVNSTDLRYSTVTIPSSVINVASVGQVTGFSGTITSGASAKQALAYKLNDCAYSLNGASAITDTSALIPTVSQLNIGNAYSGTLTINGHIASIRYYKKRLANAKLVTLST